MQLFDRRLPSRFWDKVVPEPNSGCWLWTACVDLDGYGHYSINTRSVIAHRIAYSRLVGPIPAGLSIDHLCRVRCCVNPAHLEAVTIGTNNRRAFEHTPGTIEAIGIVAKRRAESRTHCKNGHEFTPENAKYYPSQPGSRACRACELQRSRARYWAKKKAA